LHPLKRWQFQRFAKYSDTQKLRRIIHNFNRDGFKSLKSKYKNCGRRPVISEGTKKKIADVALSRPKDLGLPFTQWSLSKLRDYVIERGIVESISIEWLRQILKERGIKYRRTKTWKEFNDPEYEFKKQDNRALQKTSKGWVICFDEFGPLEVRPQSGENWGIKPDRIPATYTRKQGVRYLLSALDLKTNKIYGHIKRRKTWKEVLQFLKYLRSLFDGKVYIIIDNFSSHKKKEVLDWCEENNVELVFLLRMPHGLTGLNAISQL